jgi:hypothetical protein
MIGISTEPIAEFISWLLFYQVFPEHSMELSEKP